MDLPKGYVAKLGRSIRLARYFKSSEGEERRSCRSKNAGIILRRGRVIKGNQCLAKSVFSTRAGLTHQRIVGEISLMTRMFLKQKTTFQDHLE